MICLYCSTPLNVANSRPQPSLNQVWRRRQCGHCGALFTTNERIALSQALTVIKSSGETETFSRDKLYLSIYNACRHRSSAVTDTTGLVATIIAKLRSHIENRAIAASQIANTSLRVLKHFDTAAAVQYKAFHKEKR